MKGQVLYEKRQTKDGAVAILTMDNKRLVFNKDNDEPLPCFGCLFVAIQSFLLL